MSFSSSSSSSLPPLSRAIGRVLARAAFADLPNGSGSGVRLVLPDVDDVGVGGAALDGTATTAMTAKSNRVCCHPIYVEGAAASANASSDTAADNAEDEATLARRISDFLLAPSSAYGSLPPLTFFQRPGGVMLLAKSLVATRPVPRLRQNDMDSPDMTFTANFGMSSQELMNLLLTGRASSNVFDGVLDVGGMPMKGVRDRSNVGYLTVVEALRYVQVGTFLKTPVCPIWVVGSTSHFSVLFAFEDRCIRESNSDQILERCRRSFTQADPDNCGYICVTRLESVLSVLDLFPRLVTNHDQLRRFSEKIEMPGAGVILWEEFWRAVSRLLTGASLDSILESGAVGPTVLPAVGGGGGAMGASLSESPPLFSSSFERLGDSFVLYHYNGLRGGSVSPVTVTRLTAEDAVGASVALHAASATSAPQSGSSGRSSSSGENLEDVIRTRWPSARFNWSGGRPPSID